MARVPDGVDDLPELNIVAREVLLDGLEALACFSTALTVIGGQAIYLRSVDVDLTVPAFTSDADFSLDPDRIEDEPLLQEVMSGAGFRRKRDWPGQYVTSRRVGSVVADIGVDLLVPDSVAGRPGRRSVALEPHDGRAAGKAVGLEPALVDADVMEIASLRALAGRERRVRSARVAGPAALLVAKAYKIAERQSKGELLRKDAGDVLRLMIATAPEDVAHRFESLLGDERTAPVTETGLRELRRLFGGIRADGTTMAIDALAGDPIEGQLAGIATAYTQTLPTVG